MELDLIPEAEWEIWYQDNFDLEWPLQMEIADFGLVKGQIELWGVTCLRLFSRMVYASPCFTTANQVSSVLLIVSS